MGGPDPHSFGRLYIPAIDFFVLVMGHIATNE
jgi:hypothetical protein